MIVCYIVNTVMPTTDKKYMFEEMPVSKAIMTMAVPTIISQLINLIYNIVDTFYIGRTGNPLMIASVTVSFTLFVMMTAVSNIFGNGGGSQMARLTGQGEHERAKNVSSYAFYGSIIAGLAYSLLVLFFMEKLLFLMGASSDTIGFAKQYLYFTVVLGGIPSILANTMAHLIRNSGNSRQASIGLSGGGLLNIILDPLFMFVVFPDGMEVAGAAVATMISNIVACIYLILAYNRISKTSNLSLNVKRVAKIVKNDRQFIYSVGIPSGMLVAFFDIANIVLNAHMAAYGDFALAAIGIVLKVERLPNAFCIGICQGILPIIAYNYSSGNRERMQTVINTARKYGLIICACCIIIMTSCARLLISVFISSKGTDPEGALITIGFATVFLRIRCFQSPVQFLNYQSSFCMQAMGDGRDTFIHAVVREFVFYIPFMLLLNYIFGMYGLVAAVLAGEGCGGVFALILLRRFLRKDGKNL